MLWTLTEREIRVTKFVAAGWKNREIADVVGLSEYTIKNTVKKTFDKLGFHNRVELALWYVRYYEFGNKRFSPDPVTGVFQDATISKVKIHVNMEESKCQF